MLTCGGERRLELRRAPWLRLALWRATPPPHWPRRPAQQSNLHHWAPLSGRPPQPLRSHCRRRQTASHGRAPKATTTTRQSLLIPCPCPSPPHLTNMVPCCRVDPCQPVKPCHVPRPLSGVTPPLPGACFCVLQEVSEGQKGQEGRGAHWEEAMP